MTVVKSSRKSSTHRCTIQNRQKSAVVKCESGQQADSVKGRDREGGEEEQPRHVCRVLAPQPSAQTPEQHGHPEEEAYGEQYLPEAPEVEVLEALVAEPGPPPAHEPEDAEPLPDHAPEHHNGKGAQQPVGEEVPPPERGEEQSDAAEQGDQRQNAPHHHLSCRLVLHE